MKNYSLEIITEERNVHVSTTCNKCASVIKPEQVDHYIWETFAYPFSVTFKEGSEYEREKWEFDLCESCVIDLIKTFKIMPDYFTFGNRVNEVFEKWKATGVKR